MLEALAARIFHLGPLGTGATMKLAVNDVVFGLAGAVARRWSSRRNPASIRAVAYDVFTASAVAAPLVGYKRDALVDPDMPRSRSRWTSRARTCG